MNRQEFIVNVNVISKSNEFTLIKIEGEVSHLTLNEIGEKWDHALGVEGYHQRVIADLSDTNFHGTAGLSWLVGCTRRFRENQGFLVLYGFTEQIEEVIRLMKLDHVLTIAESLDAAKAVVHSGTVRG